jgi:hypothetical protein
MTTTPGKKLGGLKLFQSPLDFSQFLLVVSIHAGIGHRHNRRSIERIRRMKQVRSIERIRGDTLSLRIRRDG